MCARYIYIHLAHNGWSSPSIARTFALIIAAKSLKEEARRPNAGTKSATAGASGGEKLEVDGMVRVTHHRPPSSPAPLLKTREQRIKEWRDEKESEGIDI